jgi:hypothetical protein
MKKNLVIACLTPFLLFGSAPDDLNISSSQATYDGNVLILEGEVSLNHPLGNLFSDKAFLHKLEKTETFFSLVELQKNVTIGLTNDNKLSCGSADLDFQSLKGKLYAEEGQSVLYSGFFKNETTPLRIESKEFDLYFIENAPAKYAIEKLIAEKEVTLTYATDFHLTSNKVVYEPNASSSLSGTIKAYPKEENSFCELSSPEGVIKTTFIEIEGDSQILRLRKPEGLLSSSLFGKKEQGEVFFSCEELKWDYPQETLILQREVTVTEEDFGSISTTKQMVIQQEKGAIQSIYATGTSVLSHEVNTLTCFGELQVDGVTKQITALSPKEKPLIFTDEEMILKASHALLLYSQEFSLSSLTLKGDVQIESKDPEKPQRRALADKLSYHPDTKTLILLAAPGKKVLFVDEEQGITMSAQEVHIIKNPTTGKMDIQGIGQMKLSLSEEENTLLQNAFLKGASK